MIMETRDRPFYPDYPHLGYGHLSDWITRPYSIGMTLAFLTLAEREKLSRIPAQYKFFLSRQNENVLNHQSRNVLL